jgi:hypothetical protein
MGGSGGTSSSGTGGSDTGTGGSTMAAAGSGSVDPPAGGSGGGGSSGGGSCDGFAILESKCGGGSCHGTGTSFTPFAASEDDAPDFVGEQSVSCGAQDNAPIFNPDNPAASLVVRKITGTQSCGGRMPLGATMQALTDSELDCLETWIGGLE